MKITLYILMGIGTLTSFVGNEFFGFLIIIFVICLNWFHLEKKWRDRALTEVLKMQ